MRILPAIACAAGAVALWLGFVGGAVAGVPEGIAAYKAQDYTAALREFRAGAETGNAEAQFYLGWMYDNADGVEHDDTEAARWYHRAAEAGYAPAQHYLGLLYADGEGIGQDLSEAEKWFRRAAQQGNAGAQYALGIMYRDGVVVGNDPVEALKWLTLATQGAPPEETAEAAEARDGLERSLSLEQQAEAAQRAKAWQPVPEKTKQP
jgi:TPR repeat protein